jgi:hypothetical protein
MLIAKQKKEENIAEYILYMWQIEDIIRAYSFNIDLIEQQIIDRFDQPDDIKKDMRIWYENLINMMLAENIKETGHLQINIKTVSDLNDLHLQLLQNHNEIQYNALFFKTLPFLVEFRNKLQAGSETNDVELALNALYGILLLRLQKKEISKETTVAIKQISTFLSVLAGKYKAYSKGELFPEH